jgi:hypothetical protein
MADVFLSYKRSERTAVETIASRLRDLGLTVWFDASMSAGETFNAEIDREARAAKAILVCWSPAARQSEWVNAEAMIGFEQKKLAACYVAGPDGFSAPTPFNAAHTSDLRMWLYEPTDTDANWRSVLGRIGKLCGRDDLRSNHEHLRDEPRVTSSVRFSKARAVSLATLAFLAIGAVKFQFDGPIFPVREFASWDYLLPMPDRNYRHDVDWWCPSDWNPDIGGPRSGEAHGFHRCSEAEMNKYRWHQEWNTVRFTYARFLPFLIGWAANYLVFALIPFACFAAYFIAKKLLDWVRVVED